MHCPSAPLHRFTGLLNYRTCPCRRTIYPTCPSLPATHNSVLTTRYPQLSSLQNLSGGLTAYGVGCPHEFNLADHAINLISTTEEEELDKLGVSLMAQAAEKLPLAVDVEMARLDSDEMIQPAQPLPARESRKAAGFLLQLWALSSREALYVWRDKPSLIASVVAPVMLNLLFAGLFFQNGDTTRADYTLQAHFGAIAQVAIGGMFGAAQPLLLKFPLDRGIFLREYATNTYGATAYFLSKTMVELPQALLPRLASPHPTPPLPPRTPPPSPHSHPTLSTQPHPTLPLPNPSPPHPISPYLTLPHPAHPTPPPSHLNPHPTHPLYPCHTFSRRRSSTPSSCGSFFTGWLA